MKEVRFWGKSSKDAYGVKREQTRTKLAYVERAFLVGNYINATLDDGTEVLARIPEGTWDIEITDQETA